VIKYTKAELDLSQKIRKLKDEAGSHSPSIFTFEQKLPELDIKVDACFLSNPYATELFLRYFNYEILNTGKIRSLLEYYPSQNNIIAELLSDFLNLPRENIFIGNGAIEIIQAVIHNFSKRKILINIPTFSPYYEFKSEGVEVVYNYLKKEEDYSLNFEVYLDLVRRENPDTVVLINPNNPNGAFIKSSDIIFLLDQISFVKTVILDESFIHFAFSEEDFKIDSVGNLIVKYPNLIVLKSMSKDFGIAGIRAGYAIMSEERVTLLLKNGYLWNSNGFAEYFFRLYTRKDFAKEYNIVRIKYINETQDFINELRKIPNIRIFKSMANFVLIELLNDLKSSDFVSIMLIRYGIYVRTGNDKIGLVGEFIRVASRSKDENAYVLKCFRNILTCS